MTPDQLEFAISQYLDGTLAAGEQAALEERLATDPEARALFAEYQKLDSVVKSAMPLPPIAWDDFARSISEAAASEAPPVKTFKLRMGWIGSAVALAASVAIAFGIVFTTRSNQPGPGQTSYVAVDPPKPGTITVVGPSIQAASQPAFAKVTISAPPELARTTNWRYAEDIVTRPVRVLIASGVEAAQDTQSMPY